MKKTVIKILCVLIISFIFFGNSYAQKSTPYRSQIKYLLIDTTENTQEFKFQYPDKNNDKLDVSFTKSDENKWDIIIMQDTTLINKYSYPLDVIHHIGLVKPGKSEQTCVLIVSATGGNGINTNEFSVINPDFDSMMVVQINYFDVNKNTTYNYNNASLNPYRLDEIKFLIGLIGEYNMITYKKYREKR